MKATTIDQLFPDVLEEIFSHLSGSDLKNCALVCKDWDDVIGSYATTMKKLKIEFRLDHDNISIGCGFSGSREGIKIQSSDESYRKHQNVKIFIRDKSLTQLPSLDRFNISQIISLDLCFMSSGIIELNKLVELLSKMPLLQVLTITFKGECTLDTSNAPVAHFPKLKQLNVQSFSFSFDQPIEKIFAFIKADNLVQLTYRDRDRAEQSDAEIDEVVNFIKSKKSLAKLEISSSVFTQLLRRHNFSGMNLESLNVDTFVYDRIVDMSDIAIENFRKSLIANAQSLTSLSIPSWLSKEIRVTIFNRLRQVSALQIIGHDDSWMDDLSPNDIYPNLSLKTLKVSKVGAIDGFKAILQSAPQLKKLSLRRFTDDIMKEVATSAPGLVQLTIDSVEKNLSGEQRFNDLKSLNIHRIVNEDNLASLLERCPKIEVFECSFYFYPNVDRNNLIDILLQQKTLKHLRFNFAPTEEGSRSRIIFDKLKTNFGNLRSLELGYHFKFILFNFPENPAEWNVAQQEARFSAFHGE